MGFIIYHRFRLGFFTPSPSEHDLLPTLGVPLYYHFLSTTVLLRGRSLRSLITQWSILFPCLSTNPISLSERTYLWQSSHHVSVQHETSPKVEKNIPQSGDAMARGSDLKCKQSEWKNEGEDREMTSWFDIILNWCLGKVNTSSVFQ